MTKVGIIVGSLRKESVTKLLAENVAPMFPEGFDTEFIQIENLPFYNEDLDTEDNPHEEYTKFRNTMKNVDAVLFVTPEYNRTMPAVIKNALDVGSRPIGQSIWDNKPAAVMSQSVSGLAGFGANHNIRQALTFLNVYPMQQPEVYVGGSWELFDENGKLNNEDTANFLQSTVDAFVAHIERLK